MNFREYEPKSVWEARIKGYFLLAITAVLIVVIIVQFT